MNKKRDDITLNLQINRTTDNISFFYFLISLNFLGLLILMYFFFGINEKVIVSRQFFSGIVNHFFFISGLCGCILLYIDFFFCKLNSKIYLLMGLIVLCLMAIGIKLHFIISFLVKPLWLIGLGHLIFKSLSPSPNRMDVVNQFLLYISIPLFIFVICYFFQLSGHLNPLVQDQFLMAVDGTLGFYPSLIMGRLNQMLPARVLNAINMMYFGLPLAIIIIYTIRKSIENKAPVDFIMETLFIGLIGCRLYNIIPSCGAPFAFYPNWPNSLPQQFILDPPHLIECSIGVPRGCIPSLHTAWLICLIRNAWLCDGITKFFSIIFCVGSLIAIFGIGAHYLIDVVVGLCFANILEGLFTYRIPWGHPARWQAILLGALTCLGWYLIILYGLPFLSVIFSRCLFLSSILLGLYLEYRLIRAYQ